MAVKSLSGLSGGKPDVNSKTYTAGAVPRSKDQWVRNPSWLPMPSVEPTESKVVAVVAVTPGLSLLTMVCTGGYTVDWGDGVVESFGSGVQASHAYDFNNALIAESNAPVTLSGGTDTVQRTSHGYSDGMSLVLYNITGVTGVTNGEVVRVVNANADSFQLSRTVGGSLIDIVGEGTATLLPYKQTIVQITPSAGQTLRSIDFNRVPPGYTIGVFELQMLDLLVSGPSFNSSGLILSPSSPVTQKHMLERVTILATGAMTTLNCTELRALQVVNVTPASNLNSMNFTASTALRSFEYYGTKLTSCASMFNSCLALTSVILPNTGLVTSMASMFNGCSALEYGPDMNTSAVTSVVSMFNGCKALKKTPTYKMPVASIATNMYAECSALREAIDISFASNISGVALSFMFSNCTGMRNARLTGIAKATDMTSMFAGCTALEAVYIDSIAVCASLGSTFSGCRSLETVTISGAGSVSSLVDTFSSCENLKSVSIQGIGPALTNITNVFNGCRTLTDPPDLNTINVTNTSYAFNTCSSLKKAPGWNLSKVTTADNMFSSCTSLREVPVYTLAANASVASMFSGCTSLLHVPLATSMTYGNMSSAFSGCTTLIEVPALNTSSTNVSGMVGGCRQLNALKATGIRSNIDISTTKMRKAEIEDLISRLVAPVSTAALTLTNAVGVTELGGVQTKTCTSIVARNRTFNCTNTSGLAVGMMGLNGSVLALATSTDMTADAATDTITFTGHGLLDGTKIWFADIGTLTGIVINRRYYIVNATANTFQISDTLAGPPINITGTSGTVQVRYPSFIQSIVPNVSITMTAPPRAASASLAIGFTPIDCSEAYCKGWTVPH